MWGFDSLKDLLEVLLVPAVGGAIALFWPELQRRHKRIRFEALIARELEELAPHPKKPVPTLRSWTDYQKKDFLHQKILKDVTKNRDFILSLDPTLVYQVSQLWDAREKSDETQWLHYLEELANRYPGKVARAHDAWKTLISDLNLQK